MQVQRQLGQATLFLFYEYEKGGESQSECGEEKLSADWRPLGGRDRLKRVSIHEIPVLTPQLLKEKIALWPQKCTTTRLHLGKC